MFAGSTSSPPLEADERTPRRRTLAGCPARRSGTVRVQLRLEPFPHARAGSHGKPSGVHAVLARKSLEEGRKDHRLARSVLGAAILGRAGPGRGGTSGARAVHSFPRSEGGAVPEMLGESARAFSWFNWSKRWLSRSSTGVAPHFDPRFVEVETLSLSPLPLDRFSEPGRWRRFLDRALRAIEQQGRRVHARVLGPAGVLRQDPQHRPERPKRSARPWCHAASRNLRLQFMKSYQEFRAAFAKASARWRGGDLSAVFPANSYRPVLRPRLT